MLLKTVSATYGRKINLGDYCSANVEITLWADLEEGDDPALATESLRQMARNHVMHELARLKPELRAKVEDVFLGLPVSVQKAIEQEEANAHQAVTA
jgi:hypothetical protein